MPLARSPQLTPIEEERQAGLPSPLQPLAWKCCKCDVLNYFYDDNHAWYNRIPEYCIKLDCLHQRCETCSDPGPAHWPIRYAMGRPIQHLFEELQNTLEGSEHDSDMTIESGYESSSTSHTESSRSISSDEEHWRSILAQAEAQGLGRLPSMARPSHACPYKVTHFCLERFESQQAAWRHTIVHTGQEVTPCALASCSMVFAGKEAARLHYIAKHS